jgi:protein SCO1/2
MDRRTFLATGSAGATLAVAGCLSGVLGSGGDDTVGANEHVVLETPDNYEKLRDSRDGGYLPHPIHGDELPEATLPDALTDSDVTTTQFVGDRHVLMTFIFTRCSGPCPRLTANLAQVQADSLSEGYVEDVALLPTTFDIEYDTPDRLETYSQERGASLSAGNWHFLRPSSEERAETVIADQFGVFFERLDAEQREERGLPDNMVWDHLTMIVLANKDGYIERAYTGSRVPNAGALIQDVHTLRDRW